MKIGIGAALVVWTFLVFTTLPVGCSAGHGKDWNEGYAAGQRDAFAAQAKAPLGVPAFVYEGGDLRIKCEPIASGAFVTLGGKQ